MPTAEVLGRPQLARLQGVGLVSNVDRYVSAPLLVALTHRFHTSLAAVALVASGHLFAYGMSQLPWTGVLARHGPVLTMRLALGGAGLSAGVAALSPTLEGLIAARIVGGALLGAAVPAALLYVGTTVAPAQRPRGFAAMVSANGLGIVLAVAIALVATTTDLWWMAYLLTAAALMGCAVAIKGLRDDDPSTTASRSTAAVTEPSSPTGGRHVLAVLRTLALVLVEGAVVVGAVVVLPALGDRAGQHRAVAAATVALFGVTMPLTGALLRHVSLPFTVGVRVACAASLLLLLPLPVIAGPPLLALLLAAVLLGMAWSLLHPVLQAAATSAWPARTPLVLGAFVTALFVGGAVGSQLLAAVAAARGAMTFAVVCAAGAVLLVAVERLTTPVRP